MLDINERSCLFEILNTRGGAPHYSHPSHAHHISTRSRRFDRWFNPREHHTFEEYRNIYGPLNDNLIYFINNTVLNCASITQDMINDAWSYGMPLYYYKLLDYYNQYCLI